MRLLFRFGFPLVLMLIATSCSPLPATVLPIEVSPTATAVVTPSVTPAPTPTIGPRPSPTLVPTATASLEPTIEELCPARPETSLEELGLDPSSRLFVIPSGDKTRTIWNLLGTDQVLSPFKHTTFTGRPAFSPDISPDERWFAFYAQNSSGGYDLWISSIDGNQQWIARKNLDRPYMTRWVTNKVMIVFDRERGDLGPTTAFRLDPFTGGVTPMDHVYLEWDVYAFSSDTSQVIYLKDMPLAWWLYDYTISEARQVFPWANGRVTRFYDLAVHWGPNGISVGVTDDTGFDLALALPPDSFEKYDVPLIHFSDEQGDVWRVAWWSADSRLVLLSRVFGDTTPTPSYKFYLLDATKQTLYDLCLPTEELSADVIFTYASADERFLAWPATKAEVIGTLVWEIATGRHAWIPGVIVIGWGDLDGNATATP